MKQVLWEADASICVWLSDNCRTLLQMLRCSRSLWIGWVDVQVMYLLSSISPVTKCPQRFSVTGQDIFLCCRLLLFASGCPEWSREFVNTRSVPVAHKSWNYENIAQYCFVPLSNKCTYGLGSWYGNELPAWILRIMWLCILNKKNCLKWT